MTLRLPLLAIACAALLAGCSVKGDFPGRSPLVGASNLNITDTLSIPLDKIIYWGGYAGVAYLILDPLAPNWEIEEAKLDGDRYHLSLQMKRYYSGGAGEARVVFRRRAHELARLGDYEGYDVVDYSESLESSLLGSQRIASGVIVLTRKPG